MFDAIATIIGVPEDQARIMILILASYPLSIVNFQLKDPTVRLWYGFLSGLLLQYVMYGFRKN